MAGMGLGNENTKKKLTGLPQNAFLAFQFSCISAASFCTEMMMLQKRKAGLFSACCLIRYVSPFSHAESVIKIDDMNTINELQTKFKVPKRDLVMKEEKVHLTKNHSFTYGWE